MPNKRTMDSHASQLDSMEKMGALNVRFTRKCRCDGDDTVLPIVRSLDRYFLCSDRQLDHNRQMWRYGMMWWTFGRFDVRRDGGELSQSPWEQGNVTDVMSALIIFIVVRHPSVSTLVNTSEPQTYHTPGFQVIQLSDRRFRRQTSVGMLRDSQQFLYR